MRKGTLIVVMLALTVVAISALHVHAVGEVKSEVVMKVGNRVNLFHSGTADVKKEICVNDVLPVYRVYSKGKNREYKEVGQVKVVSYSGEHYFEGQVLQGEIKPGDVAKKAKAACLVQPYSP